MRIGTARRESLFTRLDFRSKLAMLTAFTVVALLWSSPLLGALLLLVALALALLAGVDLSFIRRFLALMSPFFVIILLTHGFLNTVQIERALGVERLTPLVELPAGWWVVGGLTLTREGLLYGVSVVLKTVTMTLAVPLAVFTSNVDQMIVSLVRMRVPHKLAFVLSSTLRFVPLLFSELQTIIEAQRLRGLAFERMGPARRVRVYARIAVPLILGALMRSQQLEIVLQAKAFSGARERTYLHEVSLVGADYAVIAASAAFLAVALAAFFGWGVGRFGGPI